MALIEMHIMSRELMRTVPVMVILPIDKIPEKDQTPVIPQQFPTLYLLHGVFGSHIDWVSGTAIQRWAEEKNLAVVMPAGENMFYVDLPELGNHYSAFIPELVELTRKMFPLSDKREDTYIGGLSMGGYGALMNGMKYYDTFSRIIALSAVNNVLNPMENFYYQSTPFMKQIFGDLDQAKESEINVEWLTRQLARTGKNDQKIFMACGTDDDLLFESRQMRTAFLENDFSLTYCERKGAHEWDFWNRMIHEALEWLPLPAGDAGITSGHIKQQNPDGSREKLVS